ncbi:Pentatricopeptide repeat-containing protein, mitochondrial [Sesamum alatum]|uniref:Pentatricopeptide repeat-containing protein, mitochondrial n=1 Tax=Sesamum alatum TaxID=300844 RepID=A0AAE1XVV9_9LAMI|nr:Pentatricopeptide repeat-containing protein, mitochondrial [Sesamum alatum]
MEAISPLHHLIFSPQRNFTTKSSLLTVAETAVEASHRASLEPPSSESLSSISSFGKFNPASLVQASHAQMIKMPKKKDSDAKVQSLITSYLESGDFESAARLFFVGYAQNYLHWNSFLEDFKSFGGDPHEVLEVFVQLHNMGVTFGSEALAIVLKLCANLRVSWLGLEIHVCLIKRGFDLDVFAKCALMHLYGRCWGLDSANEALYEASDHSSLLLNEAVLVTLRNEKWFQGLEIFRRMQHLPVEVNNSLTIAKVLQACGKLKALDEGKQIHGYILRHAMESNLLICNSLINMYFKNGNLELATTVFDLMENRNLSTWNSVVFGYVALGYLKHAWELLHEMEASNMKPDIVTWNSLLSGHLHHGSCREVLMILQNMQIAGFEPNTRSITTVLQAAHFDHHGIRVKFKETQNSLPKDVHNQATWGSNRLDIVFQHQ